MSLKPRKVNFDNVWGGIEDTLRGVMTLSTISKGSWNDRFLDIYIVCTAIPDPLCEELYQATKLFLETHSRKLYEQMTLLDETILLSNYYKHWNDFSKGASYLNLLYGYLNSQFIRKQKYKESDIKYGRLFVDLQPTENGGILVGGSNVPPGLLIEIGDLSLITWKNQVLQPLAPTLRKLLLSAIYKERQKSKGDVIPDSNLTLLRDIIQSFVEVERSTKNPRKLYETEFEAAYIEDTSDYYRNYSNHLLNDEKLTCSQYMHKIVAKLAEEGRRNRNLLDPSTLPKAETTCQKRLVWDVLPFLHSKSKEMIQLEQLNDLNLMYTILNPIDDGLASLIETFCSYIKEVCLAKIVALENDNDPILYVESILTIHNKYKNMIKTTFDNDKRFLTALDQACSASINHQNEGKFCRAPEQLSRYCDILLKKNSKALPESEIETKLSNVVVLFAYLKDKDIFQQFYANMLAKRLIFSTSQSLDAEENMINKLKCACGYDFTNKLYRMFTDIKLSKDNNEHFLTFLNKSGRTALLPNFTVFILQAGAWPINQTNQSSFQTPPILEKCITQFEQYYLASYNGRKLLWLFHLSMGELKLNYLAKPYFLSLNTFQMAILLLFNNQPNSSIPPLKVVLEPEDTKAFESSTSQHNALATNKYESPVYHNYDYIQHETGLANHELKKHLFALTNFQILRIFKIDVQTNQLKPLSFKPLGPSLSSQMIETPENAPRTELAFFEKLFAAMDTCVFGLNTEFQSKKTKLKLTLPPLPAAIMAQTLGASSAVVIDDTESDPSTSRKAEDQVYATVEEDRKLYLQAVIVRIMKSRKNINYNHLVQEVISQSKSRFVPSINMIKKSIETLIEKQYMKRNTETPEEYNYIA